VTGTNSRFRRMAEPPTCRSTGMPASVNRNGRPQHGSDRSGLPQSDRNVDFGKGYGRTALSLARRTSAVFTTELNRSVSIIDPATLKIIGSVPTNQDQSHMLVISRDGHRGYTTNVGPGTVSVLDLDARKTIAVIPVSGQIQRIALPWTQ